MDYMKYALRKNNTYFTLSFLIKFDTIYTHADVVELADTYDLGSYASACRFDSCHPHHKTDGNICFLCYEDPKQKQHTFNIKKCSLEIHSSVQKRLPNKRSHTHMSIILYTCEIFLFCYKYY